MRKVSPVKVNARAAARYCRITEASMHHAIKTGKVKASLRPTSKREKEIEAKDLVLFEWERASRKNKAKLRKMKKRIK